MKNRLIISILAVLICSSFHFLGEDLLKFLVTGNSATYNVIIVRHDLITVMILDVLLVLAIVYLRNSVLLVVAKYLLIIIWVISLRFYVININENKISLNILLFPVINTELIHNGEVHNFSFDLLLFNKIKKNVVQLN